MSLRKSKSTLLAKYLSQYEKEPNSRVFAPLAESYRKLGMMEEAFKILKQGISKHPTYTLGYIILGKCYFDIEDYDSCYLTLRPFISENTDNLVLLKVFGHCCIKIGHLDEALESFKYLLLANPKDIEAIEKVKELEDDLYTQNETKSLPKYEDSFSSDEDDWVHVSFNEKTESQITEEEDAWDLVESKKMHEAKEEGPVVTLTLVDLYLAQGHVDKANELLSKFEELHPNNEQIKQKKMQIEPLLASQINYEEDGHDKLLNLIETKVKKQDNKVQLLTDKLELFLKLINQRSSQLV